MEALGSLIGGFGVVLTPANLGLMFVGIVLGVLIGVLPGLGGANGVAILLPLTFTMSPTSAIIMLWAKSAREMVMALALTSLSALAYGALLGAAFAF